MRNKLVLRRWLSDDSHARWEPDGLSGLGVIVACKATSDHTFKTMTDDQLERLPEDVLCIILSKLPLKEMVRTSVLSTKWRHLWKVCPKLCFDGEQEKICVQKFIENVNVVLQQHDGKCLEELSVKFGFAPMLANYLNNWIRFAVSARVKSLSFKLLPGTLWGCVDRYTFPFDLLDHGSLSCLQHIHLNFVSLTPHPQFGGFPKLKKLDLHMVRANGMDLQVMLTNCCNLEWLSIVSCRGNGELKVDHPLPQLQCLIIKDCNMTKVEFNALRLTTFVYKGPTVPIVLSEALELKNVHITFCIVSVEHVITAFPIELPNMQSLTMFAFFELPKIPYLIESQCKLSQLKHLRLLMCFLNDVNLSLVSIMRAAPFLEKLELHFNVYDGLYDDGKPHIRFPDLLYSHLKDVCITGFMASKSQIEILIHVAENAPRLEVLTIDVTNIVVRRDPWEDKQEKARVMAVVRRIARRHVEGKISPKCCLRVL